MIETNIQELEKYLNDMAKRTNNMKPVMHNIGEILHRKSMEAFEKEQDPISGKPWSPISSTSFISSYKYNNGKKPKQHKIKSGKRHTKDFLRALADKRILRDSGDLQDSIDYTSTNDSLDFGASKEYAATHFFGDKKRNIKQRRYMPFTDDLDIDRKTTDEILEDLADYIVGD